MKREKIGLLTMPLIDNYGGIIQIAALYYFIESCGYTPYLIDKRYNLPKYKVLIKKMLEYNPFYKIYDFNSYTKRRLYLKHISGFIDSYFKNKTTPIYNNKDFVNEVKNFQTIIVGSDQVWRYKYVKNDYHNYFLNFKNKNLRKLSYAASFGVDEWEGSNDSIEKVSKLLSDFNAISVREDSGVRLCNNTFNIEKVDLVLDPTFLSDISFYNNIISTEKRSKKVELFSYVLDKSKDKKKFIRNISLSLNLNESIIYLENNFKEDFKVSIAEWLYHFKNAEFIVTDSYHGMVFSIIFNKQFIAIGNKNRGLTRFTSLLKLLDLEDRLLIDITDMKKTSNLLNTIIDYNRVNKKISVLKNRSIDFLLNNLNPNNK